MKKSRQRITLHRETLRSLTGPMLGEAAGGSVQTCGTRCTTVASCPTNCAGITCLPCTNGGGSGVYTTCCTGPYTNCGC